MSSTFALTGQSKSAVEGRQKKFVASHKFVARVCCEKFLAKKITPDFSGATSESPRR